MPIEFGSPQARAIRDADKNYHAKRIKILESLIFALIVKNCDLQEEIDSNVEKISRYLVEIDQLQDELEEGNHE